jgi:hypothetical protein
MVEVFKTNVQRPEQAKRLIVFLLEQFPGYKMNIDLTDCDKILRVESNHGRVESTDILDFARQEEIEIEILPDL